MKGKLLTCIIIPMFILLTGCTFFATEIEPMDYDLEPVIEEPVIEEPDPEPEMGLFDKMEQVSSYHAEVVVRSSGLEILNTTNLYYNNGVLLVWDYGEEVAYQTIDESRYSILWIGEDYYGFEISDNHYTNLYDFATMNAITYESYLNNQVTYEDLMVIGDVVYEFDDEGMVTYMRYEFPSSKGDILTANVTFDSYDDIDFTYDHEFQTPTSRELAVYDYFEDGYFISAVGRELKLFALNYTVVFDEDEGEIRIYFIETPYVTIDLSLTNVCLTDQYATVCYEFDDFFRIYSEYNFTKDEFNSFIDFYNFYYAE